MFFSEYECEYNIHFSYVLPRYVGMNNHVRGDVNKMAYDRNISVNTLLDVYCNIGIQNISASITKMILHDTITHRKGKNCIFDSAENTEIVEKILKKDFEKEILKEDLSTHI